MSGTGLFSGQFGYDMPKNENTSFFYSQWKTNSVQTVRLSNQPPQGLSAKSIPIFGEKVWLKRYSIFFKDKALRLIKSLGLRLCFSFDHCHPRVAAEPYCFSGQYCKAILDIRPYTLNVMKTETVKEWLNNSKWQSRDLLQMLHTVSNNGNNEMIRMGGWCENANEAWRHVLNKLEIKGSLTIHTQFGRRSCTLEAGPNKPKTVKTQDFFWNWVSHLLWNGRLCGH